MDDSGGTVIKWNEEKGFGFIAPDSGGRELFFHISDYSRSHKRPIVHLNVRFRPTIDQKGRPAAKNVIPLKGHKGNGREMRQKLFAVGLFTLFSCGLCSLLSLHLIPNELVYLYAAMSLITFFVYGKDKYAAQNGQWRISESGLHTLSLLGGWPGARLAQSFLRHKSSKGSFLFIYWITVVLNCGFLYWLTTPKGSFWLRNVVDNIHLGS
ncbi:cold shock and DUF1294 domain-containing protein [Desulfobulbus rhabdoformis]|uniref:cold shock and DUF1294 domain-containing protein n=1 Tax=Desulfobulbus rhabdoformis TaxID=34032 RepID=UPI001965B25B|nr:cold shock and DUF1294 domain-containing protein [Desulfobulbus rhabdoformis]MBM9613427.1 cold shock and DUF1294 domain-containing protein [Desulfobulbus rhabdoformis]